MKWWDESWNPIVGCSPASPGCQNCYAAREAHEMTRRGKSTKYAGLTEVRKVTFHDRPGEVTPVYNGKIRVLSEEAKVWTQPMRWRKPRTIFVCNMGDLFHPAVEFVDIERVFDSFVKAPQHLYLICTKRPRVADKFMDSLKTYGERYGGRAPLGDLQAAEYLYQKGRFANVWFGVTVEDEPQAAVRLPYLMGLAPYFGGTFISYEPALGRVRWQDYFTRIGRELVAPSWIVAGGESGEHGRPCHPDWIRETRDFCELISGSPETVRFSFKQWGRWMPTGRTGAACEEWSDGEMPLCDDGTDCRGLESLVDENTVVMRDIGKRAAGRALDGETYGWMPTVKEVLGG